MKCIYKVSSSEPVNIPSSHSWTEDITARYAVRLSAGEITVRTLTPGSETLELSKDEPGLQSRMMFEYLLCGFFLSYKDTTKNTTYQGHVMTKSLDESGVHQLLSLFDLVIIEKMPYGFSVTANITGHRTAVSAYQKCKEMYKDGQLNSIITGLIRQSKGAASSFESIYYFQDDAAASIQDLQADEAEFLAFLKNQIEICGYALLPFPGLTEHELYESELLSKLSTVGDLYIFSKGHTLCSQYILLKQKDNPVSA